MAIPVVRMDFSPVKGGCFELRPSIPMTAQRLTIETPFGTYDALVRVSGMTVYVESIRKI